MAGVQLGRALAGAMKDIGLPAVIGSTRVGPARYTETRSLPDVAATSANLTVHALRIYLPAALATEVAGRLVEALVGRIRTWRRETGNDNLEVPIYAADGETVLRIVECEVK